MFECICTNGITQLKVNNRLKAKQFWLDTACIPLAIHDIANDVNDYLGNEPELLRAKYDNERVSNSTVRRATE